MGAENTYQKKFLPLICRKSMMDIVIFTFIDAQIFTIPSVSVMEAVRSCMIRYNISEDDYSLDTLYKTYMRIRKEMSDEQKGSSKKGPFYL